MKRFIDKEKLLLETFGMGHDCNNCEGNHDSENCRFKNPFSFMDVCEIIDEQEEVDVVPIGDVYWQEVTVVANRQREKGIKTYGHGLEADTQDVFGRLDYIEEELVDALVYLRHLRRALVRTGDDSK